MEKKTYTTEEAILMIFDNATWEEGERDSSDPESAYSDIEEEYALGVDPDVDW